MPNLQDIQSAQWRAIDSASILFVIVHKRLLLIRKRRGHGAGKICAPGGHIERNESPLQCATRELKEELGISARRPTKCGELRFQFMDGYSLHIHVFRSDAFLGSPRTTPEAIPQWAAIDDVPYSKMWADNRVWIPHMLSGRMFRGQFVFDNDTMRNHNLETFSLRPTVVGSIPGHRE